MRFAWRLKWPRMRSRSAGRWRASWRSSRRSGGTPRRWRRSPTTCSRRATRTRDWKSSGKTEACARRGDHEVGRRRNADAARIDADVIVVEGAPVPAPMVLHVLLALLVALLHFVLRLRRVDAAVPD